MTSKKIPSYIKETARDLYDELKDSYFEVVLIPAREQKHTGHCIRVLQSGNPKWYSNFTSRYVNVRGRMKRPRTFINKANVLKSLQRISNGRNETVYDERLIKFIEQKIQRDNADIPF